MKTIYFITALFFLIISNTWAAKPIYVDGDNSDYVCSFRSILMKNITTKSNFAKDLKEINFSPECLEKDQIHFIKNTKKNIKGIFYGIHYDVSRSIAIESGYELVITIYDEETLMVGIVSFAGAGASLGLPIGASFTKGVLYGDCENINNYLGHFQNISLVGMNASYGTQNELTSFGFTGCDSVSTTVGFSLSLIGYSMTNYKKYSKFYFLKGERVHDLIEFVTTHR